MASIKGIFRWFIDLLALLLSKFYPDKYDYLPPVTNPLLVKPIGELVDEISEGKLKSETLVQAFIDRIHQVQPLINSVIDERYEEALQDARSLDETIRKELKDGQTKDSSSLLSLPLLGIPFAGKDSIAVKGMRYSSGISYRKEIRSDVDAGVTSQLREAGAIPVVMTNVPELLLWWDTNNATYGRTANPYNQSSIAGGSTGGGASLISSSGAPFGMASDIGGSIRIPAHFCGLFGHCCSIKTVPLDHHWPPYVESRKEMLSHGPLSRHASDLRRLVKVYTQSRKADLDLNKEHDLSKLKVYYLTEFNDDSLTATAPVISQTITGLAEYFKNKLGVAQVELANLDHLDDAFQIWMYKMRTDDANKLAFEMTNRQYTVNVPWELVKWAVGLSPHTFALLVTALGQDVNAWLHGSASKSGQLEEKFQNLKKEINEILDENSILIVPTHPETNIKPINCLLKFKNTCYTGVWNTLALPITQVPVGRDQNGNPFGVQLIARHLNDGLALAVAEQLEKDGLARWSSPAKIVV